MYILLFLAWMNVRYEILHAFPTNVKNSPCDTDMFSIPPHAEDGIVYDLL